MSPKALECSQHFRQEGRPLRFSSGESTAVTRLFTRALTAVFAIIALLASPAFAHADAARIDRNGSGCACTRPVVFFDLGQVLVDSTDLAHMQYLPGAVDYLDTLRAQGVRMGLIVNIPASWGTNDSERVSQLKEFISSGWVAGSTPFDWSYFDDRILVPRSDKEQKPAPAMFERGRALAWPCTAWYQGEVLAELQTAAKVGFRTYQVGRQGRPFYLPVEQL